MRSLQNSTNNKIFSIAFGDLARIIYFILIIATFHGCSRKPAEPTSRPGMQGSPSANYTPAPTLPPPTLRPGQPTPLPNLPN